MSTLQPTLLGDPPTRTVFRGGIRRLGPVGAVVLVLALAVGVQWAVFGGNVTGFVSFGSRMVGATRVPPGALLTSSAGYDGQFFYLQSTDPLLLHGSTVQMLRFIDNGFRVQRAAYPALAAVLALGHRAWLPYTLLLINVAIVLAVAIGFARYAQRRGWPAGWVIALALSPGLFLPVLRDLSDPLATAAVLAGLLCWQERRRGAAAVLLTIATLAREAMVLAAVAVLLDCGLTLWRQHAPGPEARRALFRAAPVILVPILTAVAWRLYADLRFGTDIGFSAGATPGLNLVQELRWSWAYEPRMALLDTVYVALTVAAIARLLTLLRRRRSLLCLSGALLSLSVLLPRLGDIWSDTRLSGAMFACLLVTGLERRDRVALGLAGAAAALTLPVVALSL